MRNWIAAIVACVLAGATPGYAQELTAKAPQPAWIQAGPLPELPDTRSDQIQGGMAYLLSEDQYVWTGDGYDYAQRVAYKVIDRSGLEEAARITPVYDPEDSTLFFSRLDVTRDGHTYDRLTDTDIELIRQEQRLEDGVVSGNLTAVAELADIRVGDIIDYTLFGHVNTPLWPGEFFQEQQVEWSVPLARQSFTISVPEGRPLVFSGIETDVPVSTETRDGRIVYSVDIENADPVTAESNVPDDAVVFGYITFSSMDSWADVSHWAQDLYDVDYALPASFQARVEEIEKNYPSPEDRVIEALRIVQDEVRYLGYQGGLGSHKPRPPTETVESGYGDCKDKTILLTAMLRQMGIDANSALASVSNGYVIPRETPSIGAFDHAIVEVNLNGKTAWLDPTMTYEGGRFDTLVPGDYGYVLPIRKGASNLELVYVPMPAEPDIQVEETFLFPEEGNIGLNFRVRTVYQGAEAEQFRRRIASSGVARIDREFLNYYGKYYTGLKRTGDLSVTDDRDANRVEVQESYTLDRETFDAEGYDTSFQTRAFTLMGALPSAIEAKRVTDLRIPYGLRRRHVIRIETPGRTFTPPESSTLSAPGVKVGIEYKSLSDTFEADYTIEVSERSVPVTEAAEIVQLSTDIQNKGTLTFNLSKSVPTLARRMGFKSLDPETEQELSDLNTLIASKKLQDALVRVNELSGKYTDPDPVRGYLQMLKGALLTDLGRRKAALPAFREGFALIEPVNVSTYFTFADLLSDEDDLVELSALPGRLFDKHPEAYDSLNTDWLSRVLRRLHLAEEYDAADALRIAAAKAQYTRRNEDIKIERWLYAAAVAPLSAAGDTETARLLASEVTDPEMLAGLLVDRRAEAVWPDIETRSGKHLGDALDQFLAQARADAEEEDAGYKEKARYLNALRQAGQTAEAVEYGAPVMADWARIEATGEDAFWFVNEYAYALADADRVDDSVAAFDRLLDLGIDANPDLISMAINRAHVLLDAGRFESALEAVTGLEALDGDYSSDYGKMFIYDAKACALQKLGRPGEAEGTLTEQILPISEVNRGAYTHILLCLGRLDEAEAQYVERLSDRGERPGVLYSFVETQGNKHDGTFYAEISKTAETVKARKSVRDALAPVGRRLTIRGSDTYWGRY